MRAVEVNEGLFALAEDTVRVELGWRRVTAKATAELLSNEKTAAHYRVSKPVIDPATGKQRVVIGMGGEKNLAWDTVDAQGKPIKLGQPFQYLDYQGPKVWYVYKRTEPKEKGDYFTTVGAYDDFDEAMTVAKNQLS